MSDDQPSIEFSEQDQADLASLGVTTAEAPEFHPILEVWLHVFAPAHDVALEPVTPQWANKITSTYRELDYVDTPAVRDAYYEMLFRLEEILKAEIETDPDCLSYRTPEDDVANNSGHYRQLLTDWQVEFMRREVAWDPTSETAAIDMAVLGEVHKIIFGAEGITAFLDNIKFEFSEQDQAALREALEAVREEGR